MDPLQAEGERLRVAIDAVVPADDFLRPRKLVGCGSGAGSRD